MTIIENIDVVMGAKTSQLDSAIVKEMQQLNGMRDSLSGLSASAAAFTPVGALVSATVAGFARNLPGVSTAVGVFTASTASILAAMKAKEAKANDIAKSLSKITKEATEAANAIEKVAKPASGLSIVDQALKGKGGAMPAGLRERDGNGNADQLVNAALYGSKKDMASAFVLSGSKRSEADQKKYTDGIDQAIAKTATYKSTWTSAGSAASSAAGLGAVGAAGIAAGVGVAVVAVAGLVHVMGEVSKEMTVIDDMSDSAKRLGSSFKDLSVARLSLGQTSGMDAGGIDSALQKMTLNLSDAAATGTGDAADRLKMIGVNAGEALKKGPLEAFKQISLATSQLKNPTDQLAVAYELFGKQGAALVLSLREGPGEIERMEKLSSTLGMNLSDAQAEQVGAANDAWEEMGMIATGAYRQIAAEVAPVIQVIAESITEVGVSFSGWQGSLTSVVDNAVYFSGVMFDAYEVINLQYSIMSKISNLDFSGVGTEITDALDFGTGQKNLDAVNKAREDAANKVKGQGPSNADSLIAKIEREKEATKKLTEAKKEASKLADKQREEEEKKGQQIADQIQSLRENNDVIREGNRLRALGVKFNESDLAMKMKLGNETMGSSNQAIDKILAEKQALEQTKADQEKAAGLKSSSKEPQELLKDSLKELTRLRKSGMIDEKTWMIQAKKAEESAGFKDPSKSGAVSVQAGSVAAYKLLMERDSETVKVQKQIERINETQLEVLREMNTNLSGIKPMRAAR